MKIIGIIAFLILLPITLPLALMTGLGALFIIALLAALLGTAATVLLILQFPFFFVESMTGGRKLSDSIDDTWWYAPCFGIIGCLILILFYGLFVLCCR